MAHDRTRLAGVVDVATAALHGGLATIQGVHSAIARKPFGPLRLAPVVGDVSNAVQVIHDGVTSVVYGGLRAAIAATGSVARLAAGFVADGEQPRPGSPADLAVAALNGFAGDRLAREGSPLATPMELRHLGRSLAIEPTALAATFPHATSRLAVFVHGLGLNESWWQLHAERHYGDRTTTHGSRLQADLGYTPLYLRYNTGLHVSDNGKQFAQLLARVVAAWPVAVDELIVIGHSMGGLVSRSACHYAREANLDWVRLVRHIVFLGSPHLGAPLEKAVNVGAWLLGLVDVTRPLAEVVNGRSVGIKDLRFGSLRDEDWHDVDIDEVLVDRTGHVPFLDGANHYFVAATITRDRRHPIGVAIGDLLVREASAFGRGRLRHTQFPLENGRHFGPMNHFELLNHPDLYDQMRRWLTRS